MFRLCFCFWSLLPRQRQSQTPNKGTAEKLSLSAAIVRAYATPRNSLEAANNINMEQHEEGGPGSDEWRAGRAAGANRRALLSHLVGRWLGAAG